MFKIILFLLISLQTQILFFRIMSLVPLPKRERFFRWSGYLLLGILAAGLVLFESSFQWPQFSLRSPTYSFFGPS
ncbi:MAG: hypothetical protein ACYC9S_01265 [Leptospirales bacterium]